MYETPHLKKYILRCALEMLFDKIRYHRNLVDATLLPCMTIACVIVAMKLILQYDAITREKNLIKYTAQFFDECSVKTIIEMEIDILETTNYQGCHEVRRRLKDAKNPGDKIVRL